jgi:hypothetical protein
MPYPPPHSGSPQPSFNPGRRAFRLHASVIPFTRVAGLAMIISGAGIPIHMQRPLVESMGGTLEIDSVIRLGAMVRFVLDLPQCVLPDSMPDALKSHADLGPAC